MIKIYTKYLTVVSVFCIIIFISFSSNLNASADNIKYLSGTVVFSDNLSPVNDGVIQLYHENETDGKIQIIETVEIGLSGTFTFSRKVIFSQTNGTKIMAYPNDYDNFSAPFFPSIVDLNEEDILNNENLVIQVERKNSLNQNSDQNSLLKQNFPNPFNPTTLITFELPQTSNVTLNVYNMNGETVATLIDNRNYLKGLNQIEFNAGSLASGIYIYRLDAGAYTETRKMMLIK